MLSYCQQPKQIKKKKKPPQTTKKKTTPKHQAGRTLLWFVRFFQFSVHLVFSTEDLNSVINFIYEGPVFIFLKHLWLRIVSCSLLNLISQIFLYHTDIGHRV